MFLFRCHEYYEDVVYDKHWKYSLSIQICQNSNGNFRVTSCWYWKVWISIWVSIDSAEMLSWDMQSHHKTLLFKDFKRKFLLQSWQIEQTQFVICHVYTNRSYLPVFERWTPGKHWTLGAKIDSSNLTTWYWDE